MRCSRRSACLENRNHVGAVLERVQVIRPGLHHFPALSDRQSDERRSREICRIRTGSVFARRDPDPDPGFHLLVDPLAGNHDPKWFWCLLVNPYIYRGCRSPRWSGGAGGNRTPVHKSYATRSTYVATSIVLTTHYPTGRESAQPAR